MPDNGLPAGWRLVKLGEIAQSISGVGFPERLQGLLTGEWPMLKVSDLSSQLNAHAIVGANNWLDEARRREIGARILPVGSVVFPKVGAAIHGEKRRVLSVPSALDNNMMGLAPRDGLVTSGYLFRVMERVSLGALVQDGGLPSVNQAIVNGIQVRLPPPDEQRRIAEVLDSIEAAIEKTEAVIAATERLRSALLGELLTRGVPGWHTKWTVFPRIGRMPTCWEVVGLGELLREPIRNGYSAGAASHQTGWWILTLSAVTSSGFNPDGVKPVTPDARVISSTLVPGDLLVSRSNTRDRVGLAGIYRGEPQACSYPDLLMRVRVDTGQTSAEYLETVLLSSAGRAYFERESRGTSGSMVKIEREILMRFPVPLPPVLEQSAIRAGLDSIASRREAEIEQLHALRLAKSVTANGLLSGRVRIGVGK